MTLMLTNITISCLVIKIGASNSKIVSRVDLKLCVCVYIRYDLSKTHKTIILDDLVCPLSLFFSFCIAC